MTAAIKRGKGKRVGGFARARNDLYATAVGLSRPMLALERFEGDVWECACGDGQLAREIRPWLRRRDGVIGTDIEYQGYGERGSVDFLQTTTLLAPNIVTNPPFNRWLPFAQHALNLGATKVVMLGSYAKSAGQRAARMMRETQLARVLVCAGRVNMLPPGGVDLGYDTYVNYAWYVWEKGHQGPPALHWFEPGEWPQ